MENERDFMYFSKVTNRPYATKEELIKAEDEVLRAREESKAKALAAQEAREKLKAQRADRAKEIEQAYADVRKAQKHLNALVDAFCKDYGSFHMTVKDPIPMGDFFEDFFEKLF